MVQVLPDGFQYQDRFYKSLSAIPRQVTGTRWNGYSGPTISSVVLPANNSSNADSSFVGSDMRSPIFPENATYTKCLIPSVSHSFHEPLGNLKIGRASCRERV